RALLVGDGVQPHLRLGTLGQALECDRSIDQHVVTRLEPGEEAGVVLVVDGKSLPLALGELEVLLPSARRVHRHAEQSFLVVGGRSGLAGVVGATPVLDDRQGTNAAMDAAAVALTSGIGRSEEHTSE